MIRTQGDIIEMKHRDARALRKTLAGISPNISYYKTILESLRRLELEIRGLEEKQGATIGLEVS